MRIAIVGQRAFGKSVLEAFLARGDTIAGVFSAPEKPGARSDPLKEAAIAHGLELFQLPNLKSEPSVQAIRALHVDLAVMAFVLQFASEPFIDAPRCGTIQYHPSLLPKYRGASALNWPIIKGESATGLSIFRPTAGPDEGPVIVQKSVVIGPDETMGEVYFGKLFPMGVEAMLEAADLVVGQGVQGAEQDETAATYEGRCTEPEARIIWNAHIDLAYNLLRGCDPSPGAWTTVNGQKLWLFGAKKHPARRLSGVAGKPGQLVAIGEESIRVAMHGGTLEIFKVRAEGKKIAAADFARSAGLTPGTLFDREPPRAA